MLCVYERNKMMMMMMKYIFIIFPCPRMHLRPEIHSGPCWGS